MATKPPPPPPSRLLLDSIYLKSTAALASEWCYLLPMHYMPREG